METLFRATALEARFPLNMNVLDATRTPLVMSLPAVLRAWLDHRHEVLVRRSRHRLAAIERRIEILDGYLLVYLNVDEVIRIIRNEDEPKPRLMQRFKLTDIQAEAILNMRLRSLRRLEEMEIRKEHKALSKERKDIQALLKDDALRWERIAEELEETRQEIRLRRARCTAHRTRRRAGGRGGGERCLRRARADHRHPVRQGLDPRGQGPHRRRRRTALQGRRQAEAPGALPDHRSAHAVRHQRPSLHAEGRRPAARPRRRPAGAPARGPDQRGRCRRAVRRGRGRAISGRLIDRARLRRAGGGTCGGEAHRQAGAEPQAGRGGGALRARRMATTSRSSAATASC